MVDQTKVLQTAADQKVNLSGYQYLETDVLRMAKLVCPLSSFQQRRSGFFGKHSIGATDSLIANECILATISPTRSGCKYQGNRGSGKAQSTERFSNIEEGVSLLLPAMR